LRRCHCDGVIATVGCFDRVIVQGTLPDICHPGAITGFFNVHHMRLFDFQQWAAPMRHQIHENIKALAAENQIDIEFVRKKNFRKEQRVKDAGRSYRGLNLFSPDDAAVFHAIAQGGVQGFGVRNSDLRALLAKTSSQQSRILKRLRNHGVIKKAGNTYQYDLTKLGRQVVATS